MKNEPTYENLDFRATLGVAGALFAIWAALVIGLTLRGQPGVVCFTPAAWLLAAVAGRGTLALTRSTKPASRRAEAGVAGALLGGLLGIFMTVMLLLRAEQLPGERLTSSLLGAAAMVGGLILCALIAFVVAARVERGGLPQ